MTEIEVKIRIQDPKAVREKLLGLGAAVSRERHRETNALYDNAAGDLRAGRRALRLRATGKRATLTFKGEPQKSRSFKVREEFETQVRDPKELRKILIDETSVGNFLELEGERHEITRFARSLGFGRTDFITSDYVEMIVQAGEKGGSA
jgi:adenylate cyclase class 2